MARKPRDAAWLPAIYEAADVEALQALSKGIADPAQQGRALKWIVETAAETYGLSYRSDGEGGERETAFALGQGLAPARYRPCFTIKRWIFFPRLTCLRRATTQWLTTWWRM